MRQASETPRSSFQDTDILAVHPDLRTGTFGQAGFRSPCYPPSSILLGPEPICASRFKGENLPQVYQEDWTPKPSVCCFVNQSHHGLDPRSPNDVRSRQDLYSNFSTWEYFEGPRQTFRSNGYRLCGSALIFPGNQPNIQHIVPSTPMPSGEDDPEMDQWVSYDDQGCIAGKARSEDTPNAGPWNGGDSGDFILPKGKYTHAHNLDHRAFLLDFFEYSLPLLLPRAGATVRYHPEAFRFYHLHTPRSECLPSLFPPALLMHLLPSLHPLYTLPSPSARTFPPYPSLSHTTLPFFIHPFRSSFFLVLSIPPSTFFRYRPQQKTN
ncbi:MAG: hypothetical protein Q9184_004405 [Pyrenodesmia sp. 2 TL-2023]